jgi:hypothetical protein
MGFTQFGKEKILADVCRNAKAFELSAMIPLDALTEAMKLETLKVMRQERSNMICYS